MDRIAAAYGAAVEDLARASPEALADGAVKTDERLRTPTSIVIPDGVFVLLTQVLRLRDAADAPRVPQDGKPAEVGGDCTSQR